MARYVAPEFDTVTAFAAACAAQRINGDYIKTDVNLYDEERNFVRTEKFANKVLMRKLLDSADEITDADRANAEQVIKHCKGISFKLIVGKTLSDFEQAMLRIADQEIIKSNYDLAVIASLPAAYARAQVRNAQDIRLRQAAGVMSGAVDTKVEMAIEVVRCNYSNQWQTYYVTGMTAEENVVFFAFRKSIEIGSTVNIKGKIKAHKEDRTQLSHVKIL